MHVTLTGPFKATNQQVLMIRKQQVLKTTANPNDASFYWKLAFAKRYLIIVHVLLQTRTAMLVFTVKVSVSNN